MWLKRHKYLDHVRPPQLQFSSSSILKQQPPRKLKFFFASSSYLALLKHSSKYTQTKTLKCSSPSSSPLPSLLPAWSLRQHPQTPARTRQLPAFKIAQRSPSLNCKLQVAMIWVSSNLYHTLDLCDIPSILLDIKLTGNRMRGLPRRCNCRLRRRRCWVGCQ
jgi:hypothetical protein